MQALDNSILPLHKSADKPMHNGGNREWKSLNFHFKFFFAIKVRITEKSLDVKS